MQVEQILISKTTRNLEIQLLLRWKKKAGFKYFTEVPGYNRGKQILMLLVLASTEMFLYIVNP